MGEEAKLPSKEELLDILDEDNEIEQEPQNEDDVPDPILEQAMGMGYNPEGVEGKRNLSPEEFIDRQKLYDDIRSLKRQNKKLHGDVDNITKYQDRIREDERKKVINELKIAKEQALDDGDHRKVVEIDEEIATQRSKTKDEELIPQSNDAFDNWKESNAWYDDNVEMRSVADGIGQAYFSDHPNEQLSVVYKHVEGRIKELYPDKFGNKKREAPNTVEGATTTTTSKRNTKSKYTIKDLPEEERAIMRTVIRTTRLSEEDYLKEYFS